jgi:lantibiotic leader peptide-processing serine protease
MKWGFVLSAACVLALALAVTLSSGAAFGRSRTKTYVVLYERGVSAKKARAAIRRAGGRVTRENRRIGLASVRSRNGHFAAQVSRSRAVYGAARNRPIGTAFDQRPKDPFALERMRAQREASLGRDGRVNRDAGTPAEPFADLQWDMRMIHATPSGSYATQPGRRGVLVGVIDTGIDASHPDIAPNFVRSLSRNFTTDIPIIDGDCSTDPDGSCSDPPDVDEDGHGTHVAGTIAAPLNGLGMAGVAPRVKLVNLRAGQDTGFFFLQPTVDALTYAGDHGIDVVNMSFYTDPWLYNCADNPADSPQQQAEQRTIVKATQRALNYARDHGVTPVAANGNEHTDLGNPTLDETSPDFPPNSEYSRQVDNSCVSMPGEARGVTGVTALGPSGRKSYYSNYGLEQSDVSAPGGDRRDYYGTSRYNQPPNTVLAPYPKSVAEASGDLNPDGTPNTPFVLADCSRGPCAYYQYLQGTSMASPHAVGVAAIIVSSLGEPDPDHDGLTLSPSTVRRELERTAQEHACPSPRTLTYPDPDLDPGFTAVCEGSAEHNGFYGHGIVDALAAGRG